MVHIIIPAGCSGIVLLTDDFHQSDTSDVVLETANPYHREHRGRARRRTDC